MTKPLETVHFDMCSLMMTICMGDVRDFATFINDFLKKVWLYALKSKRKCLSSKNEKRNAFVETQSEYKPSTIEQRNVLSNNEFHVCRTLKDYDIEKQMS